MPHALYYLIYSLQKSNPLKLSECSVLAWTVASNLLSYTLHSTTLSTLLAHSLLKKKKEEEGGGGGGAKIIMNTVLWAQTM